MSERQIPVNIAMIGPSLSLRGGIASVQSSMLTHKPSNIEFFHISSIRSQTKVHNLYDFALALCTLVALLARRPSIRILHLHFASRGSILRKSLFAAIGIAMNRQIVLHAHGGGFDTFSDNLPRILWRALYHLFQRSACVLVLSESWRSFYINQFDLPTDKVVVLPNPVAVPTAVPNRSKRLDAAPLTIVFLGRIQEAKGAFDAIDALSQLPLHLQTQTKLVLAGDGHLARARAFARRRQVENHVTIHDWLSRTECEALLQDADIFVLPSHQEGLPMALLEAMAWGLPVITTAVGGIPEWVKDGQEGLLVPPGNPSALANAMMRLLTNSCLREQLGQQARRRVAACDIQTFQTTLQAVYRTLAVRAIGVKSDEEPT